MKTVCGLSDSRARSTDETKYVDNTIEALEKIGQMECPRRELLSGTEPLKQFEELSNTDDIRATERRSIQRLIVE